jgi:hypothetical protein
MLVARPALAARLQAHGLRAEPERKHEGAIGEFERAVVRSHSRLIVTLFFISCAFLRMKPVFWGGYPEKFVTANLNVMNGLMRTTRRELKNRPTELITWQLGIVAF